MCVCDFNSCVNYCVNKMQTLPYLPSLSLFECHQSFLQRSHVGKSLLKKLFSFTNDTIFHPLLVTFIPVAVSINLL